VERLVRNQMKRRLREAWRMRLEDVPRGRDYVLIARPGLPETAEARGFEWLSERVGEVLGKASA
jgi:ribonuclease P protein component